MSTDRVKRLRAKNLKLGRRRREMYLTDSEFIAIKDKVKQMRKSP